MITRLENKMYRVFSLFCIIVMLLPGGSLTNSIKSNINTLIFISNDQFVFHPRLYSYNIQGFIEAQPGGLKSLELGDQYDASDVIEITSYYYSINPKVLLTLIGISSSLLDDQTNLKRDLNIYKLESGLSFEMQVRTVGYLLFRKFYEDAKIGPNGRVVLPTTAASEAIRYLFDHDEIASLKFSRFFKENFNNPLEELTNGNSITETPILHYPWLGGENDWKVGSFEYHHGFNEFPPSFPINLNTNVIKDGIDFIPPIKYNDDRPWCDGPSNPTRPNYCSDGNRGISPNWVVASADGEVVYRNWSFVAVRHSDEWSTMYYHIADEEMAQEGPLPSNLRIGHPSNATTWGGYSSTSHVHFSIAQNGYLVFPRPLVENFVQWDGNTIGVTVYENANYSGKSLTLTDTDEDLCNNPLDLSIDPNSFVCFSSPSWNDVVSSVKIAPGWSAVLYLHSKDQERSLGEYHITYSCNSDVSDFSAPSYTFPNGASVNDNISRIVVQKCIGNQTSWVSSFNGIDSEDPCAVTQPPSTSDNGSFISDITIPDGTVTSPGQSLTKTWRVKNTGSSTWGSGYKLVFREGEQMGAPTTIDVPTAAPGQEINLSVPITAPSQNGQYHARFQLRNPQGTFFGDPIWVKIEVITNNPGGNITLFDITPASPSSAASVHIVGRARFFSDFRSMRFVIGHEVHEMENIRQVGDQNEISFDWNTASLPRDNYAIVFEVSKNGDPDWVNAERQVKTYTLTGTPASTNRPPDRPLLKSPYNWYLKDAGGSPSSVELCVNPVSDPDGNSVLYYFEVKDQGGGVYANSGWVSSACWSRPYDPNTYSWRVKSGDGSAESDWSSDAWNFSVAKGGVYIGDINFFQTQTNDTHICVMITYDGIQAPEVYAWLNKANDGSENGEWRLLDHYGPNTTPDCTQPNYHGWWIHSPEYTTGNHKLQIKAEKKDSGASQIKTTYYNIDYIRPSEVNLLEPSSRTNNGTWWNTRSIHFQWSQSLRAENYTIRVSTSSNPWSDPAPIVDQTVGGSITSFDHTFSQDYSKLYWSVRASNIAGSTDSGPDVWFGIDTVQPTCQVQALPSVNYENVFQVGWTGTDDAAGVGAYDIQFLDSGREEWKDWLSQAPASKPYELFSGQPGHTYSFRCRSIDNAGNVGKYPGTADTFIKIDPAARPPAPWWNSAYSFKRNLTIQNNMANVQMEEGYPVRLQFTSGTSPTASEIYNASQSSTKCDDIRIVYNDTTELHRLIENCTSEKIVIWFRSQLDISGGSTNNTAHQIYYGNPSAVSPPQQFDRVFWPEIDANTLRYYSMREGAGTTINDLSGHGNGTMSYRLSWLPFAKFGPAVSFPTDNDPEPRPAIDDGSSSLPTGAFTIEWWMKLGNISGGSIANQNVHGYQSKWVVHVEDYRRLRVSILSPDNHWSEARWDFDLSSNPTYRNDYHHYAITFNGDREVKFYLDGDLISVKSLEYSGINNNTPISPLRIGAGDINTSTFNGVMFQFVISQGVRVGFPHGSYGKIIVEPSVIAGAAQTPPAAGSPDLVLLNLSTFPNPGGGTLVQAQFQNQGTLATMNGFFTDAYIDHLPSGAQDYSGSIQFWINDPIAVGQTVTVTTVVTDLLGINSPARKPLAPASEITGTLYAQVDSTGAVNEPDNTNNIWDDGVEVCFATPDAFEVDDTFGSASLLDVSVPHNGNFDGPDDQDWMKFIAATGKKYTVKTSDLGVSGDTYLYLYDTDGTTLLTSNDDFAGSLASQIDWTAPADGTYYILVKHWNPNVGGCGTTYSIRVSMPAAIYLPIIQTPPNRLTSNTGNNIQPSFSPDGQKIVFTSDRDGNREVYIKNIDGESQTRLTNTPGLDEDMPSFSPDGSNILYSSDNAIGNEIYLMDVDGSNQRNLSNAPNSNEGRPRFSATGTSIVFDSDRSGSWQIYTAQINGSTLTNITAITDPSIPDIKNRFPSFIYPGNQILFRSETLSGGSNSSRIYKIDSDGGNLVQLSSNFTDRYPTISNNGLWIAFTTNRSGNLDIYLMKVDGSSAKPYIQVSTDDDYPAFSPNVDQFAFASKRAGSLYDIYTQSILLP